MNDSLAGLTWHRMTSQLHMTLYHSNVREFILFCGKTIYWHDWAQRASSKNCNKICTCSYGTMEVSQQLDLVSIKAEHMKTVLTLYYYTLTTKQLRIQYS